MTEITDPTKSNGRRSGLSSAFSRWLRAVSRRNGDGTLAESLEDVLEEHDEGGQRLTPEERHMLMNILSFGEVRVYDVMVPRADIVAVEEGASLEEVLTLYREHSHSRMPIYHETLDDPLGFLHIKDVVDFLAPRGEGESQPANLSMRAIRRELLFVPPSMPALDLLLKMQATRIHLALVIDEYGGTDGLVSIEDLIEEIVGEIEDEHDTASEGHLVVLPDGSIEADARADVEELEEMLNLKLVSEEDEDDVDTLGGLIFSLLGRIPGRGELVRHPAGLEFEVRDADPRRIKKLRIHRVDPEDRETSEDEGSEDNGGDEGREAQTAPRVASA